MQSHSPATQVELIRKTSQGITGTFANANCHAQPLLPLLNFLQEQAMGWKFFKWKQGHNVHQFVTEDGRVFVLRPIQTKRRGYIGLRVNLRMSRANEIELASVYAKRPLQWGDFSRMMRLFAKKPTVWEPLVKDEH